MSTEFILIPIVVVIGIILLIRYETSKITDDINNKSKPDNSAKPSKIVVNDKLVLIENSKIEYLKKGIEQYCNLSNRESFLILPTLVDLGNKFVIIFPFDIEFDNYCYFINYIINADELCSIPDYKPKLTAWCATKTGDEWMTNDIVNKKVMIYIPDWDEEHDNVYLTTEDNLGYKMGFAIGESHQRLDKPVFNYSDNPIELSDLKGRTNYTFD